MNCLSTPFTSAGRLGTICLFAVFLGACASEPSATPKAALPLTGVNDAFACAALIQLPAGEPIDASGLHNTFRLSEKIVSGSEPIGRESFERLTHWGVKTVLSVDGKAPEAELAAKHGLTYVHIPLHYKGIDEQTLLRLAKVFRELPSPFYVHCFHGRHRGPAAAAVGRLVVDQVSRQQALAEMRQWCGTSPKYVGLYEAIAHSPMPSSSATAQLDWVPPTQMEVGSFRRNMSDLARVYDELLLASELGWSTSAEHPNLQASSSALRMRALFQELMMLGEVQEGPAQQLAWVEDSLEASTQIAQALQMNPPGPVGRTESALDRISQACSDCHREHRNH